MSRLTSNTSFNQKLTEPSCSDKEQMTLAVSGITIVQMYLNSV